jgi:hypothetical protein
MANSPFQGLSKLMPKGESKPAGKEPMKPAPGAKPMPESGEGGKSPMTIHDHGDGTYHSEKDGMKEEHPDLLHMTTHVAHSHAPESKHHHSMHDGFAHATHGVTEDGQHHGTNEHESGDQAANEMKQFMGGESDGGDWGSKEKGGAEEEQQATMGGM